MLNMISVISYGIKQNRLLQENENYLKKSCINFGVNCIPTLKSSFEFVMKNKAIQVNSRNSGEGWLVFCFINIFISKRESLATSSYVLKCTLPSEEPFTKLHL